MTNQELKIRVVLDTEDAKKQLADLAGGPGVGGAGAGGSTAGKTGQVVGGRLASSMSAGPRMLSGIPGAGMLSAARAAISGAIAGPTEGSIGDILGEGLGGYGSNIENYLFGTAAPEARAAARTRESVMGMFALQAGREGAIPAQAYSVRDQLFQWNKQEEVGRGMIERDESFRQMLTESAEAIGRAAAERISGSIEEAVRNLPATR